MPFLNLRRALSAHVRWEIFDKFVDNAAEILAPFSANSAADALVELPVFLNKATMIAKHEYIANYVMWSRDV